MSNVSVDSNDSSVNDNQTQDNPRRRFLTVATVTGSIGPGEHRIGPGWVQNMHLLCKTAL